MKKVHEILEEAQAMVKANVSDFCLGNGNVRYSSCIIVWKGWKLSLTTKTLKLIYGKINFQC